MQRTSFLAAIGIGVGGMLAGFATGFGMASARSESAQVDDLRENYTDRGRRCLEAAAMLRNNEPERAIAYLEDGTRRSIQGVPMGRTYEQLLPKSQVLLVSAKRYEARFPDSDFNIDRLCRGVPADHAQLSAAVEQLR